MADFVKPLAVFGLGVAALGVVSVGIYHVGYNRGVRARGASGLYQLKTYNNSEDPLAKYLIEHNVDDTVLCKLRNFSVSLINGVMSTPVEEGKLLTVLCKAINAKKAIDIGVFTGCSAYAMALGLPASGRVIACDMDEQTAMKGKPYWEEGGVADKIDLRIKPATETLQELIDNGEEGTYDIVFMDADKINYPNYYRMGMRLLRSGGLVVVDNAMFTSKGNVLEERFLNDDTRGIWTVNKTMRDDERTDYVLLNVVEGVGIALKK